MDKECLGDLVVQIKNLYGQNFSLFNIIIIERFNFLKESGDTRIWLMICLIE